MCVCLTLNVPAAVCRKLCDRTQGAEGPLGAAVRQSRRVAVERAETDSHSNNVQIKAEKQHHINKSCGTNLILKKLLKEELPLLPKASSFSRFLRRAR